jgi:pilus assembly protein Flp/PilA
MAEPTGGGWAVELARLTLAAGPPRSTGGGSKREKTMRALVALRRALRNDDGQGLAEYALILALIAIVAIIALIFLGGQVSSILSTVGSSV